MKAAPHEDLERRLPKSEVVVFLFVGFLLELVLSRLVPDFFRADFLLIFVTYVAWYSRPFKGAAVGCLFGMLQDYLMGVPVGLNGLSKSLIGFLAGYLHRWTSTTLGSFRIAIIATLAVIDRVIVWLTVFVVGLELSTPAIADVLTSAALTGLLGEVFFRLYDKIRFPPKDFRRLE